MVRCYALIENVFWQILDFLAYNLDINPFHDIDLIISRLSVSSDFGSITRRAASRRCNIQIWCGTTQRRP